MSPAEKNTIHERALFSDETAVYKSPYQPQPGDTVAIRFRAAREDALSILLIANGQGHMMREKKTQGRFRYYEAALPIGKQPVFYYFSLTDSERTLYYSRLGVCETKPERGLFSIIPTQRLPEWALGTVYYQIFPDRFCNGEASNDVVDGEYCYHSLTRFVEDWDRPPEKTDVSNFYGGDLQGIMEKLDYLQELGVRALYLNPIFISPSNHKYDTQDYAHVDPHLGIIEEDGGAVLPEGEIDNRKAERYIRRVTSQINLQKSDTYFASLVEELHRRGMRIVLDGVFNHCGSFHRWMDREGVYRDKSPGAFLSEDSPYRDYFRFKADKTYDGWWGYETLPKLNYEDSRQLWEEILQIGEKWVSAPYSVDGWRLDVAADLGRSPELNHRFWRSFHDRVRSAAPDTLIMAEHYGDASAWLDSLEWDTVMNYSAFMEPVTWFLTGMEKHSDQFDETKLGNGPLFFSDMREAMSRFPRPSLDAALNQLSNHDHSRFLTRTNRTVGHLHDKGSAAAGEGIDKRVLRLAVLMQMTWPGSPGIYYGDEAGQVGWTDPDNRRTYPWGNEDRELIELHRQLIAMRGSLHCLRLGSLKELAAGQDFIAYGRFDDEDTAVVLINLGRAARELSVPVWELGVPDSAVMSPVFVSGSLAERCSEGVLVKEGLLRVRLDPVSGAVFSAPLSFDAK